ncbi:hypothetical protein MAR_038262, partial [Mya arenaria]
MLRLAGDIKKLQNYLEKTADECLSTLDTDFEKSGRKMLNKVNLSRLVMFNRTIGAEVERMNVSDYNSRKATSKLKSALSSVERMLCARFDRVEISGKESGVHEKRRAVHGQQTEQACGDSVLMNFVGHVIEVHSSFYRLPQGTIQVTKTGKLLTAFNNGTIGKYSGKSLDEISLD